MILKSCDDFIVQDFGRIKSQIKSIFKTILNQIKITKNNL